MNTTPRNNRHNRHATHDSIFCRFQWNWPISSSSLSFRLAVYCCCVFSLNLAWIMLQIPHLIEQLEQLTMLNWRMVFQQLCGTEIPVIPSQWLYLRVIYTLVLMTSQKHNISLLLWPLFTITELSQASFHSTNSACKIKIPTIGSLVRLVEGDLLE